MIFLCRSYALLISRYDSAPDNSRVEPRRPGPRRADEQRRADRTRSHKEHIDVEHPKVTSPPGDLDRSAGGDGRIIGGEAGMILAFGLAVVMNFSAYWFSDQ